MNTIKLKFLVSFCLGVFGLFLASCNPDEESSGENKKRNDPYEIPDSLRMFIVEKGDSFATFKIGAASFSMIKVKAGDFYMGAQSNDSMTINYDKSADSLTESPVHKVSLTEFHIGATEVTEALWYAVMGTGKESLSDGDLPISDVSYTDVTAFFARLNAATLYTDSTMQEIASVKPTFVLPTEAQWEYAARGGVSSKGFLYAGSNALADVAWYLDNASSAQPVAKKLPNELGLYDMSGNVMEWCQDRFDTLSYVSADQTDPISLNGKFSVVRSGSFQSKAEDCRVSSRKLFVSTYYNYIGFRLAY
ncbi:MAG TPA: formylglycine-generating enzyme family protein [Paludibacteraceae bacterium]|nr:formylglycine-generating enzyme family protein [Paludibacteraceae bacterium]HQJ90793.1 formylglycine-generating enzyme family protein [Paludibacteraceae bacterium]